MNQKSHRVQITRKSLHVLAGIVILAIARWSIDTIGLQQTLLIGAMVLLLEMAIEFIRIESGALKMFDVIVKKNEVGNFSALTHSIAIGLVIFAIVDVQIAFASMAIFVFGDAAAAIAGTMWGAHHCSLNNEKTWEGFWAFAVVGILSSMLFVPGVIGVPMALLAGTLELLSSEADDNFFVPLSTAFFGLLLQVIF